MKTIKIKTPAKINLTLEILGKRPDGYHNIKSIMQAVSLYDTLTISIDNSQDNQIILNGNNQLIPYDKSNLVYIAADKFLQRSGVNRRKVNIYIDKNIPVAAGLAGGSSNAAGTLYGLNCIFDNPLSNDVLSDLASEIGADVNFCLHGGTQLATLKGEKLEKLTTPSLNIVIVKPKDIFISAREAYEKYSGLIHKPTCQHTDLIINVIRENNADKIASCLYNALEYAIIPDYPKILKVKQKLIKLGCINTIMSGSGPSVFGIYDKDIDLSEFSDEFNVFKVKSIDNGTIPD